MRNATFLLLLIFILVSCNDLYSKNKEDITDAVNKIEAAKRTALQSVEISGHDISGNNINVYVSGKSVSGIIFTDTLSFETTGDGYLINK